MMNILDLCAGKWEREETGGDQESEVGRLGWTPEALVVVHEVPQRVPQMPHDLLDMDPDSFLDRMSRGG